MLPYVMMAIRSNVQSFTPYKALFGTQITCQCSHGNDTQYVSACPEAPWLFKHSEEDFKDITKAWYFHLCVSFMRKISIFDDYKKKDLSPKLRGKLKVNFKKVRKLSDVLI